MNQKNTVTLSQLPLTKPVLNAWHTRAHDTDDEAVVVRYADGTGQAYGFAADGSLFPFFVEGCDYDCEPSGFSDVTYYAVVATLAGSQTPLEVAYEVGLRDRPPV